MAKLKTFEQYVAEKAPAADLEVVEATVVMDAVYPKSKGLAKLLKKNKVSMEILDMEGPSGFPEVELTGSKEDLITVLSDNKHGWDDVDLAEYIEESNDTFTVKVKALNEEETEEVEEAEEVEETEDAKEVAEMLKEVYESCKSEAKVWEEDAHDDHTVESYMKENAALVAALAAGSLKEMKEDYTTEQFESACNEMVDAYTTKINEMKESDSAEDAEDVE